MKYEPLSGKKQKIKKEGYPSKQKNSDGNFYLGFVKGVDESFEVFDTYIDYYKEYKDDVKRLMNEQKNIWKEWVKFYEDQADISKENYLERYNNWLFDYIFSNISGDDSFFSMIK